MTAEHVHKLIELVGTSGASASGAIQNAINRAADAVRSVRWFEVVRVRGEVAGGEVARYRVSLKVGFALEEG
jgi:flavin-binding protein dodecin